jgi:type II secretion system protein N
MLYLRFPGEVIEKYINTVITVNNPDAILTIENVRPDMTLGIKISNLRVGFRDRPLATLQIDQIVLRPDIMSAFQGDMRLFLDMEAYGGTATGKVISKRKSNPDGSIQGDFKLNNIPLEKIAYLKKILNRQIEGKLNSNISFRGSVWDLAGGNAKITILLTNGVYPLLFPNMDVDKMEFSRVDGDMTLQNRVIKISKLKLTGDKMRAEISGEITLNTEELENSPIELVSVVDVPGQQGKKLSFDLIGSIGNSVMRLKP